MSGHSLTRRDFLGAAGLAVAAAAKPNIIFLFSDDHHYQCLGAVGNPHIHTPNLDRLAARGVNFTNGIISTSQCAPSRGIALTGLEAYQSGLLSNGQRMFREGIGPTVVEQLRRGGYDTSLVGKWHIQPTPAQCGFTQAPLWFPGGSMRYTDPNLRRGLEGAAEPVPGHITDLLTGAAVRYVDSVRQPFLLWLAYNAPHSPLFAAPAYRERYESKDSSQLAPPAHPAGGKPFDWVTYYSVITHLDEAIGRLVAHLEKSGLWKNTVLFFVGDNGFMCGTRSWTGKVVPWEESIRVPFLAAGGPVESRGAVDTPVASIDLPATWLDLAGLNPSYALAGPSLKGILSGRADDRPAAFSVWCDGRPEALSPPRAVEPYRVVRTRRDKLIVWESGRRELYNWRTDPAERWNLAQDAGHRTTARELEDLLRRRMKETDDPAISWLA